METLSPVKSFLRVANKRFGMFAMFDEQLNKGATLVYLYMFWAASQRDHCWPSQETLATVSKSSVRSVQTYIRELIALGYIRVEKRGKHNIYRLLLSEHVKSILGEVGVEMITEALRDFATSEEACTGESIAPVQAPSGAKFAPEPAPIGAKFSYRSKSILLQETNTPLSPLPGSPHSGKPSASIAVGVGSPRSPLQKHPEGGESRRALRVASSCEVSDAASAEFERLFLAWPLKQDKLACAAVYGKLAHARRLPSIDTLLAAVERMKAEDRRWQAGYVPSLKFWLLGERWNDEPHLATSANRPWQSGTSAPSPQPFGDPALQQAVQALHERLEAEQVNARNKPPLPDELTHAADTLCDMWPMIPRKQVLASLGLVRFQGGSLSNVVVRAREYVGGLAGRMPPMPVGEWLRSAAV